MLKNLFLGGSRQQGIMTHFYKNFIKEFVVVCPNLTYLGMERTRDLISTADIMNDCLNKLKQCEQAVFVVESKENLNSEFIKAEIDCCNKNKIPYSVIIFESKIFTRTA